MRWHVILSLIVLFVTVLITACGGGGGGGGGWGSGTPVPEINLVGGTGSIASGSTENLGNIAAGSPQTLTYTISNLGTAVLNLTGTPAVVLSGQTNCSANVTSQPAASIAASGASNAVVSLTVSSAGVFSFMVSIANDDANENPYVFTVQGSGIVGAPEIDAFVGSALLTNGGTFTLGRIGMDEVVGTPLVIRNLGNAALVLSGTPSRVAISGVSNGSVTVRDEPAASVAAGDATVCMLLVSAGTSGTLSASFSIANNDSNENPFTFTLQWPISASANILYEYNGDAYSASVPGGSTTTLSSGLGLGYVKAHLGDRALFSSSIVTPPSNLFLRGIPPAAPATAQNLTAAPTGASGEVNSHRFAAGDNSVVLAYDSAAVAHLYSISINGASASAPVLLSGTVPSGAGGTTSYFEPSPQGDRVAFVGDLQTAGVLELFVNSFTGGTRQKLNAALGGKSLYPAVLRWLPDGKRFLYMVENNASGNERDLYLVDLSTGTPSATKISGAVSTGAAGVWDVDIKVSACGTRIFFLCQHSTGPFDLFMVSLQGGTPSAPASLKGGVVAAGASVGDFSISPDGKRVLFGATTGPGSSFDLYYATISGTSVTTTKVVNSTATSSQGVRLFQGCGFVTETKALYQLDDLMTNRRELFFLDLSGTPASVRITTGAAFPGTSGVENVFPLANGAGVIFRTAQGGTTAGNDGLAYASLTPVPGAVRFTPTNTQLNGATWPSLRGTLVVYSRSSGATYPVYVYNTATTVEWQLSGAEVTNSTGFAAFFGAGRVLYSVVPSTGPTEIWTAAVGPAPTQNRVSGAGHHVPNGILTGQ